MTRSEAIEFAKEQQEIFGGKMGEFLEYVENELTQTNTSNTFNALDCVDTISRAEAIEWIKNYENVVRYYEPDAEDTDIPIDEAVDMLERVPSAERRGKWDFIRMEEDGSGNGFYKCSCCGKGDIHAPEVKVSYCWNCGAKMITDKDDTQ